MSGSGLAVGFSKLIMTLLGYCFLVLLEAGTLFGTVFDFKIGDVVAVTLRESYCCCNKFFLLPIKERIVIILDR